MNQRRSRIQSLEDPGEQCFRMMRIKALGQEGAKHVTGQCSQSTAKDSGGGEVCKGQITARLLSGSW